MLIKYAPQPFNAYSLLFANMRNKHRASKSTSFWGFLFLVFYLGSSTIASEIGTDEDDNSAHNDEHLLTKLDCKPGQQTEYVMATQSSFLEKFENSNLLVKTKLSLKCLKKRQWTNATSGKTYSGQLYEAKIHSMIPIQIAPGSAPSLKTGKLQMETLFNTLDKVPESDDTGNGKGPNIKVGAVNKFFEEFASTIGEMLMELFRRLVKVFEQLIQRKKDNPMGKTTPISLACSAKNPSERNSRRFTRSAKSATFGNINNNDYRAHLSELYRLPWTFLQLEEGTVVEVKLSPLESMPDVKHFKQFISSAFSTQLNEANKERIERSTLGKHTSHYEIEYDMARNAPEDTLRKKGRFRRASLPLPVVSIVRSVRSKDILQPHAERNHLRHRKLYLEDLDFTAQQVQLVEGNVLVASGGHFRSMIPLEMPNGKTIRRETRSLRDEFDKPPHFVTFDDNFRHAMTMNLEYSMVKIDSPKNKAEKKNNMHKRTRRGTSFNENFDSDMIYFTRRLSETLERAEKKEQHRRKRFAVPIDDKIDSDSNIKCHTLEGSQLVKLARQVERESNLVVDSGDELPNAKQCHEHKEFGSRVFKAYFNRTVTSRGYDKGSRGELEGRDGREYFDTNFKVGAQFMGEDVMVGHVHLASHRNHSRLAINLFGSEYVNLDLCEIRNKTFNQANLIPLFNSDIWFMTNVGVKIRYDFDLNVNIPEEVCHSIENASPNVQPQGSSSSNAEIINKIATNARSSNPDTALEMRQKSRLNLAAQLDASFIIFSAEMRVNGHFDMDSNVDFGPKCLTARSYVRPMNVSMNFNYKFFHPVCNEWMEDNWQPRQMKWELTKNYRSSWFDTSCSS